MPPLATQTVRPHVLIIGGGLAGLAAAAALADRECDITLLEARRRLGGRAGSYVDPESGELIDHCQHVAMGCCTNYLDFCRRTGTADLLERHSRLHFYSEAGQRCDFEPSRWLPAPLHLLPALRGLSYLSSSEQRSIGRAILALARSQHADSPNAPLMLHWLEQHGQSAKVVRQFWEVVLVSALGDTLDRVSVAASQKVFVDGFLAARSAADVLIPKVSLGELYDEQVAESLRRGGVCIRTSAAVQRVECSTAGDGAVIGASLDTGELLPADFVVLAVTWRKAAELLPAAMRLRELEQAQAIVSSPISGLHLWFDRPLLQTPHAVLVGRLSQWLFRRPSDAAQRQNEHYLQVVVSGSHSLAGRSRESIIEEVLSDVACVAPEARGAKLLRSKIVTAHEAVFSMAPGIEALRPPQRTPIAGLMLAGDWTRTGWPATMEGAVRSGYLAAEEVLADLGRPEKLLVADLPRSLLSRWLF